MQAVKSMSAAVMDWAHYQNLAGEVDTIETSTCRGTYDWKAYLHEETAVARRREAREKKAERPVPVPPAPAPASLYV